MASPNSKLKKAYLAYNRLYFNGELPTDTIVKWEDLGPQVVALFDPSDYSIIINRRVRTFNSVWRLTLLHEMCHSATADEAAEHGPRWLREMRRLSRLGAFDKLW